MQLTKTEDNVKSFKVEEEEKYSTNNRGDILYIRGHRVLKAVTVYNRYGVGYRIGYTCVGYVREGVATYSTAVITGFDSEADWDKFPQNIESKPMKNPVGSNFVPAALEWAKAITASPK